jgi:hypothetical protein
MMPAAAVSRLCLAECVEIPDFKTANFHHQNLVLVELISLTHQTTKRLSPKWLLKC